MRRKDILGQRFGRLLVIQALGIEVVKGKSRSFWLCRCDCGVEKKRVLDSLRGYTSCGCYSREQTSKAKKRHGLSRSSEHNIWLGIKGRCGNPKNRAYKYYGGRGITMHKEWYDSFEAFIGYVGMRPSKRHSIDRIDNNGNYEPGNIRWATISEQALNRSDNKMVEHNAEIKTLKEWCDQYNLHYGSCNKAITRKGVTIQEILSTGKFLNKL